MDGASAKIITSGFESFFPSIHNHFGESGIVEFGGEEIHALTLTNVHSSIGGHVDDVDFLYFPEGQIFLSDFDGNFTDVLYGFIHDDSVFHVFIPQSKCYEVLN